MSNMERRHAAIWATIEAIAERLNVSASRLAILSGNDATAFNKSKRVTRGGILRWPSSMTIAKVLDVAGMPFAEFGAIVDEKTRERD